MSYSHKFQPRAGRNTSCATTNMDKAESPAKHEKATRTKRGHREKSLSGARRTEQSPEEREIDKLIGSKSDYQPDQSDRHVSKGQQGSRKRQKFSSGSATGPLRDEAEPPYSPVSLMSPRRQRVSPFEFPLHVTQLEAQDRPEGTVRRRARASRTASAPQVESEVVQGRGEERGPKKAGAEKVTELEGRKATKVGQKKVSFRDEVYEFEVAQAGRSFSGGGKGDSVVFAARLVEAEPQFFHDSRQSRQGSGRSAIKRKRDEKGVSERKSKRRKGDEKLDEGSDAQPDTSKRGITSESEKRLRSGRSEVAKIAGAIHESDRQQWGLELEVQKRQCAGWED
jgi:hypothetical protein